MNITSKQLYGFLSACSGNWRNCVYISADGPGCLLSTGQDGQPIIMAADQFQQLTSERIDPAECCGQLTVDGFKTLFAKYLIWHMPSAEDDPLRCLWQSTPGQS